jgi:hypothetical protein
LYFRNCCAIKKQLNFRTILEETSQILEFYGRIFAVAQRAMRQIATQVGILTPKKIAIIVLGGLCLDSIPGARDS